MPWLDARTLFVPVLQLFRVYQLPPVHYVRIMI
jgi:hypothetical protein